MTSVEFRLSDIQIRFVSYRFLTDILRVEQNDRCHVEEYILVLS